MTKQDNLPFLTFDKSNQLLKFENQKKNEQKNSEVIRSTLTNINISEMVEKDVSNLIFFDQKNDISYYNTNDFLNKQLILEKKLHIDIKKINPKGQNKVSGICMKGNIRKNITKKNKYFLLLSEM